MMKQRWRQLAQAIDARSPRERGLLLAVLLAVLIGGWSWLVLEPLEARQTELGNRAAKVDAEVAALHAQLQAIASRAEADPNRELRDRLERLQARLATVDREIQARGADFVEPAQMAALLRDLLSAERGLTLLRLESVGAQRLPGSNGAAPVYRHGLVLEFRGNYLSTLRYLEALEALPWRVLWEELDYRLETHPNARVRLRISTLSGREDWIGV